MGNQVWSFINSKKSVLSGILFTFLIFTTFFVQGLSTDLKLLSVLQGGLGTCFSRVNQSFTSKIMGAGAQYLQSDFFSNTEECVGDVIEMAENNLEALFGSNLKRLNSFSSDLHWFHQQLEGKGESSLVNNPENLIRESLITRFEKIEQLKEEIIAVNDEISAGLSSTLVTAKLAFYLLTFFLPLFMIWAYLERREKKVKNIELDQKAHEILMDSSSPQKLEIERILLRAFEQNDMKYCSKLFTNYRHSVADITSRSRGSEVLAPNQKSVFANERNLDDKIDDLWDASENEITIKDLNSLSMQKVLNKVIDGLASVLQGHGVLINVEVEAEQCIYAEIESLEQVLYHVVNDAINSCLKSNKSSKQIHITSSTLGGSYLLDIEHNGIGFEQVLLNAESGLVPKSILEYLGIGQQIAYSFMQEFDGKIQFDNIKNTQNDIVGGKQRLIFHSVKVNKTKLIDLKVGKKQDVLSQMAREI